MYCNSLKCNTEEFPISCVESWGAKKALFCQYSCQIFSAFHGIKKRNYFLLLSQCNSALSVESCSSKQSHFCLVWRESDLLFLPSADTSTSWFLKWSCARSLFREKPAIEEVRSQISSLTDKKDLKYHPDCISECHMLCIQKTLVIGKCILKSIAP